MDKIREEFEEWWISKNPNHTDVKSCWHETGYWVNSNSAYSNLDFAWECWKASRAALRVELPTKMSDEVLSLYDIGFNDGIDGAIERIEDTGVSHK